MAPLSDGTGVKGKVNQALSGGPPVVGCPDAFEGIRLTQEREIMVANKPQGFAHSLARMCINQALWQTLP